MKIAFICSSLSPGKDGVGDYTRSLASALSSLGVECKLISINDHASETHAEPSCYTVDRYEGLLNNPAIQTACINQLKDWKPDWVSFQYVPFAYPPNGLNSHLRPFMLKVSRVASLHMMFHEIWLGEKPSLSSKLRLLGQLQKFQITRSVRKWIPQCIHTSNTVFSGALEESGIPAKLLPLFGNINIHPTNLDQLSAHIGTRIREDSERVILFPFSQPIDWNRDLIFSRFINAAEKARLKLHFIQVGQSACLDHHWANIESICPSPHRCTVLGPQSEATISQLMQAADLGVSSYNRQLVGKSGAAHAMLEHGLPVLCSSSQIETRRKVSLASDSRIYEADLSEEDLQQLLTSPPKSAPQSQLMAVAQTLLTDLADCK